jgi:hypothetical protein
MEQKLAIWLDISRLMTAQKKYLRGTEEKTKPGN